MVQRYSVSSLEQIKAQKVLSGQVPAEFEVVGFFYQDEKHFVYWEYLHSWTVGIIIVLRKRMLQIDQFKDNFK